MPYYQIESKMPQTATFKLKADNDEEALEKAREMIRKYRCDKNNGTVPIASESWLVKKVRKKERYTPSPV